MKMNKKVLGLTGLAAVAAVGGTWAFYNQTHTVANPFSTEKGGYSTSFTEVFNPAAGEDWTPGEEVEKYVKVTNTGEGNVLVRVKMEEKWYNKEDDHKEEKVRKEIDSSQDAFTSVEKSGEGKKVTYEAKQAMTEDGKHDGKVHKGKVASEDGDDSVVYKNMPNLSTNDNKERGKWFWDEASGFYYWYGVLEGQNEETAKKGTSGEATNSTSYLLKSVTLASNVDMGAEVDKEGEWCVIARSDLDEYLDEEGLLKDNFDPEEFIEKSETYTWLDAKTGQTTTGKNKVQAQEEAAKSGDFYIERNYSGTSTDENEKGYADSDYDLIITTQIVQATEEALNAEWTKDGNETITIPQVITDLVKDSTSDQAEKGNE